MLDNGLHIAEATLNVRHRQTMTKKYGKTRCEIEPKTFKKAIEII